MHPAAATTPTTLVEKAQSILTSTSCSDELLRSIGLSNEEVLERDWHGLSGTKIVAKHLDIEEQEHDLAEFHLKVSTRMATHLALTVENFMTAEYRSAGILSTVPELAQESARLLRDHLLRKPALDMSSFERTVRTDDALWSQLDRFSDHQEPTLLWRQGCAFRDLFAFLAVRFLSCGDSVLNAEGIHSRWQHLLRAKHSIKHPLLSSILKVAFALTDGADLPSVDVLLPHYSQVRIDFVSLSNHGGKKEMYLQRFNLSRADAILLKGPRVAAVGVDGPDVRWVDGTHVLSQGSTSRLA